MSGTTTLVEAVTRYGEPVMVRRRTGTTGAFTDVTAQGVPRQYKAEELLGGLMQGDERVVISNAEILAAGWPGPPRSGDLVVWQGSTRTVRGVRIIRIGAQTLGFDMWVRG